MRVLSLGVIIVFITSCTNSNSIPAGIIPKQKMEIILSQLMQSDEYANTLIIKDSTKKISTEKMRIYQQVFDLNKVSLKEFKESYQFYMAHPDITKVIFDSISARASRERASLYKPVIDSTKTKPVSVLSHPVAVALPKPVDSSLSKMGTRAIRARDARLKARQLKPSPQKHPAKSIQ